MRHVLARMDLRRRRERQRQGQGALGNGGDKPRLGQNAAGVGNNRDGNGNGNGQKVGGKKPRHSLLAQGLVKANAVPSEASKKIEVRI
jgi:hypothetical protein